MHFNFQLHVYYLHAIHIRYPLGLEFKIWHPTETVNYMLTTQGRNVSTTPLRQWVFGNVYLSAGQH